MAGGVFADQPFFFNPKCVVISIILMVLYWILPYRNPFMLPIIFLVGYIAIAWYDYLYNCDLQMYSGTFPVSMATLDSWGKPQRRFENNPNQPKNLLEKQELVYKKKIYALHAIFIAPLLLYIGWYRQKANRYIWSVIGSVAFLVFLYHGLRLVYPRDITSCKEANKKEQQMLKVIYLIHIIVVGPLLTYIAYMRSNASKRIWDPLLGLSIVLFLYNSIRYFVPRNVKENC